MENNTILLQVFGPDLPPGGDRLFVELSESGFQLTRKNECVTIPWSTIALSRGGFDGQQLMFAWQRDEQSWSAMLVDYAQLPTVERFLPAANAQALRQWKRAVGRAERRFRFGIGTVGILLALPLLVLIAFLSWGGQLAEWVSSKISVETEQQIGALLFEHTRQQLKLIDDPAASEFLADIGTRLTRGSTYTYRWYIAHDESINAFAMPAGYVVVNTGLLLAAESPEEVAGVVAHEIQHVELRHSLRGLVRSLGWSALVSTVLGDISSSTIAGLAQELGALQFSREQESQADAAAFNLLDKTGINPEGMMTFFKKLGDRKTEIELLSTHPTSDSRLQSLENLVKQRGPKTYTPLAINWAEWRQRNAK